uniref:AAA+ ATPase domain-containing protein n=1 Tax=Lactococcus lactis subsp. lactis bv. diacetylactis TaxID=44688 RepID=G1FE28_LACLL|nr:DNA/RNA helicase domain-containing protein [Lactococcus lactis]AEK97247.1 conserved hypothetical protein [Lactococcus lactis subsp. lactis bv. diacetylactis]
MKSGVINLETYVQSFKESQILDAYKRINRINDIKESECNDLEVLANELIKLSSLNKKKLFGFQLDISVGTGFQEQFDLLRFSNEAILNIELKSQIIPLKEIQDQLDRHNYLLGCLPGNKKVILYTFISSEKKVYVFKDEELRESTLEELFNSIPDDYYEENPLLNLKSEDFIISPYSDIDRYLNARYFLNSEQKKIVREVTSKPSGEHVMIKGGAGTGKSLVLFDLANKLTEKGKPFLLVFCSTLKSHNKINSKVNFSFTDILNIDFTKLNLLNYDYILLDESQRLWKAKYESLLETKSTLIFAVDKAQTLQPGEEQTNIEGKLDNLIINKNKYNLKEKVRTDISLSTFIHKLFNKSRSGLQPINFPKVNAVYFDRKSEAEEFVKNLIVIEEYVSIEVPQYKTRSTGSIKNQKIFPFSTDGFNVIGREFDNVLIPIDDRVQYVSNELKFNHGENYYPYLALNGLFQAITRVKNNLLFLVIGNVEIYKEIQKLITWENDKNY